MHNFAKNKFWFLFLIIMPLAHSATTEHEVLGTWINQAGDGLIKISLNGDKYEAVIIGGTHPKSPERKDINNPDPKLKTRPLKGLKILGNLSYEGDNEWDDGWIYDPNNGKTYDCQMTLEDKNTLSIRGYVGTPMFGRTETWRRHVE